jgi:hypothetical protein
MRTFEGIDLAPIGAAMGIENGGVGVGAEIGGVETDRRIQIVIIAMGRVNRL